MLEAFWKGSQGRLSTCTARSVHRGPLQGLGPSVPGRHALPTPPPADGPAAGQAEVRGPVTPGGLSPPRRRYLHPTEEEAEAWLTLSFPGRR